jgi:cell wall-associated NlpC family hydrolase
MRRLTLLACALALLTAAATAGAQPARSWAAPEIQTVVQAGLMATSTEAFRPNDPVTQGELAITLSAFGMEISAPDPNRRVTLRELDAKLVSATGLRQEAQNLKLAARYAGLRPGTWFGTETVARLLGLRINHPKDQEHLELQPSQPATRAEAAYSIARLLELDLEQVVEVRETVESFALPGMTPVQRTLIARAARFVGRPYVWAGTSERAQKLAGRMRPGGFDCSGFVWRVFKLEPTQGAPALPTALEGRTTYEMSAEISRKERISLERLQPADLVFFGDRGRRSKPSEVGHMGIYVGNGWMLHSSDRGTTLIPMTGWYETRFAWGRNVLVEVGNRL